MPSWKLAVFLPLSWACSYVELPWQGDLDAEPSYLIARTMELANLYGTTEYRIEVVPRSGSRTFGYLAPMNLFHFHGLSLKIPFEGMNEAGLTVSAHYLAQAVYEEPLPGQETLNALDLVPALLANCSSVDEATRLLESVKVVAPKVGEQNFGGLHWAITDPSGRTLIVEYLEGKRMILENHPRVMTNDPDIRWHWRNLNTYVNLSPNYPWQNDILQIKVDNDIGTVPRPIGHGWNLFGLPGDPSPPSRFARLFYLRGYATKAKPLKSFNDAVVLGNALLNNVFLPIGPIAENPREPGDGPELTDYAVLKSPKDKVMLIRGYVNSQWRQIDLKRLDFSKSYAWPLEDGSLGVQDITNAGEKLVQI